MYLITAYICLFNVSHNYLLGFPGGAVVRNPPAKAGESGDDGAISGSGRSPGVGNSNPLIILPWTEELDLPHTHIHTHTQNYYCGYR